MQEPPRFVPRISPRLDALEGFTGRISFSFQVAPDVLEPRTVEDDPKRLSPLIKAKRRGRAASGNGGLGAKSWSE